MSKRSLAKHPISSTEEIFAGGNLPAAKVFWLSEFPCRLLHQECLKSDPHTVCRGATPTRGTSWRGLETERDVASAVL